MHTEQKCSIPACGMLHLFIVHCCIKAESPDRPIEIIPLFDLNCLSQHFRRPHHANHAQVDRMQYPTAISPFRPPYISATLPVSLCSSSTATITLAACLAANLTYSFYISPVYTISTCMIPIHLDSFISFSSWRYEASRIHYYDQPFSILKAQLIL